MHEIQKWKNDSPETVRWHFANFTSSCSILCQAPKQKGEQKKGPACSVNTTVNTSGCVSLRSLSQWCTTETILCVVTELHRAWDLWKRMFDVLLCQHLAALIYIFVLCVIMMWMGSVQLKIYCEAERLLCLCQVVFKHWLTTSSQPTWRWVLQLSFRLGVSVFFSFWQSMDRHPVLLSSWLCLCLPSFLLRVLATLFVTAPC